MQEKPYKAAGNYNELQGQMPVDARPVGRLLLRAEEKVFEDWRYVANTSIRLVNTKADDLLGPDNKLTGRDFMLPRVVVVPFDPEHPDHAGHFRSGANEIFLFDSKIKAEPMSRIKVFTHEYLHFLSHNGRDDSEQVDNQSPLSRSNNVGFRRSFGLDIRDGAEDILTPDYFLSFNEAVTEQLAADLVPGVHETYSDYRGLLNQVIEDAAFMGLGSRNSNGDFKAWTSQDFKDYIYICYFKGDLANFTNLLQTVYAKYNLTEQQFGLMTHRDDLPTVIEAKLPDHPPNNPPPHAVALMVQQRLNIKTAADYHTDVIGPEPGDEDPFGLEYDEFIKKSGITISEDPTFDIVGLKVYRGDESALLIGHVTKVFDELLASGADVQDINIEVDRLLFEEYRMSMLSDHFRNFYIHKHTQLEK